MKNILSNEEIEMLAEKYQLIKRSQSKILNDKYKTFYDFLQHYVSMLTYEIYEQI